MSSADNPFKNSDGTELSCIQMLNLILDGDASPEQHQYFKKHLEECMPCYKSHELDIAIRDLLKVKCSGNHVPDDLVNRIKTASQKNNNGR
ncbi:MAG: anti-sigma factor [Flammeovirgaceae bacterium]|nr:anti-sigma factor [Flammeovirgaceae bacterium]